MIMADVAVNVRIRISNGLEIRTYIVGIPETTDLSTRLILAKTIVEKVFRTKVLSKEKWNLDKFT